MSVAPEARLLVAVAGGKDGAVRAALQAPLDWDLVLELAQRHGLGPLLHRDLDALPDAPVPKAVRARLWARAQAISRRNALAAEELGAIVARLDAHGIAVIPYKGPTLAVRAYGDVSLREFGDLDLLLRRDDVARAKRVLVERGYSAVCELTPAHESLLIRSRRDYELGLANRARGMLVELHWRGDPQVRVPPLDDASWWAALPRMTLGTSSCATLSSEDLLLLLCLHGSKHFWSSLGWLVDVVRLARREAPDWGRIQHMARRHGCERRLALPIALANEVLDVRLADAVAVPVDRSVHEIARDIAENLFVRTQVPSAPLAVFRDNLRLCDDIAQRASWVVATALTPGRGEWTRWRLPRPFFFLYPVLRVFRLFAKYALRLGPAETQLTPRLEDRHGDGVGQIDAAIPG